MVRDYEPDIQSITLRPFDDGRFIVYLDGRKVFDKETTGKFPKYELEIKPALERQSNPPT